MYSSKKKGEQLENPQGVTLATGLNSSQNITPTKLQTAIDSIVTSKGLQWTVLL